MMSIIIIVDFIYVHSILFIDCVMAYEIWQKLLLRIKIFSKDLITSFYARMIMIWLDTGSLVVSSTYETLMT